jgi:glyoxalase family protein
MELKGIHHLTAISARIADNHRFYTQTMGMRLVKRSVNQDDVSAWHLFYADAAGSPGTDLTFFDWPLPPETRGSRSISRTALRISGAAAFDFWERRLADLGVAAEPMVERDGRLALDFEDPEGQRLCLVEDGGTDAGVSWARSSVPAEYQIRGLGPIHLTVPDLKPTHSVLERIGMREARTYPSPESKDDQVHVYQMGPGGPGAELHVEVRPALPPARQGAGGVHHVAFRIPDAEYDEWADSLNRWGIRNSGKVDRHWFRSLYFREPNGILFELATEGPGFAVDEAPETLGEKVVLAPFLEPRRKEIEAALKPID